MGGTFTGPGALRTTHRMVPIEARKGESRTVEHANNGGDVDLAGWGTEGITPVRPSTTREQPAAGELPQNGIQKIAAESPRWPRFLRLRRAAPGPNWPVGTAPGGHKRFYE